MKLEVKSRNEVTQLFKSNISE